MKARHIIETENWEISELTDDLNGDELLALGLSAANMNQLELAERVANRFAELLSQSPNNAGLTLMHAEVAGLTKFKQGEEAEAFAMLNKAVDLTEQQTPPRGAASPLKPVHELTAAGLLASGDYEKAAELYEASLRRMANRPRALLGAARSYAGLGDNYNARLNYQAFYTLWNDDNLAEVQEAKTYLRL